MLKEHSEFYKRLEQGKRELLQHMDNLTEDERKAKPGKKELSPLQVLAHVIRVEETVSRPGTEPNPDSKVQIKGRIFMLAMVNLMRPGFRIPTTPVLHPAIPDSYETLKHNWEKARKDLASRIESISKQTQGKPIVNHMMAGPLTASMALDFLEVHLQYHLKNFPRIKNKSLNKGASK